MKAKRCTKCHKMRVIRKFSPRPGRKIPYDSHCYDCKRQVSVRWERKNSELIKAKRWHYRHTKNGYLHVQYQSVLARTTNPRNSHARLYYGLPVIDQERFRQWALSNPDFHKLWDAYEKSGFQQMLAPSINRIDSTKGYVLENIEYITTRENSLDGLRHEMELRKIRKEKKYAA